MTGEKSKQEVLRDASRREIASVLGAAFGALALSSCANEAGAEELGGTGTGAAALTGTTHINWVDTQVALRALAGGADFVALLESYATAGDGGGGLFAWTSDVTSPDDGGTVIVPTGTRTGCWKRIYSGALDIRWFGASPNVDTAVVASANVTAFVRAIGVASGAGGRVFVPAGNWYVNQTIVLQGAIPVGLEGVAAFAQTVPAQDNGSWLRAASTWNASYSTLLQLTNAYSCSVRRLGVDGQASNSVTQVKKCIEVTSMPSGNTSGCTLEDIFVQNATDYGIHVGYATTTGSVNATLVRCFTIANCPVGILQDGPQTALTVYEKGVFLITTAGAIGYHIVGGDVTMYDNCFESSAGSTADVLVDPTADWVRFINAYHELGSGMAYSFPFPMGATRRFSYTEFSGVRVLNTSSPTVALTFIDYNQPGQVVCLACLFDGTVNSPVSTVNWHGTGRTYASPSIVEIGTQYFNGATNSIGAEMAYQSLLGFGATLGGYNVGGTLASQNSYQYIGNAPFAAPAPTSGGFLYVSAGALWYRGPTSPPTMIAPA